MFKSMKFTRGYLDEDFNPARPIIIGCAIAIVLVLAYIVMVG